MTKTYKVEINRRGKTRIQEGTIKELIQYFSYTLECGKSWEHEKGNKKISMNPRNGESLVKNLNNAKSNTAANGYSDTRYKLVD